MLTLVLIVLTAPIWCAIALIIWTIVVGVTMWLVGFPITVTYPNSIKKKYRWFHEIK